MEKKHRVELVPEVAAKVLVRADRTCCVCRTPRKPIQIHHIDDDPTNSAEENLAVLCFDCHRETQIRGGFDRKLDRHQIVLYLDEWCEIVRRKWHGAAGELNKQALAQDWSWSPPITDVSFQGKQIRLGYVQISEKDEASRYSLSAEYPEIVPNETPGALEINLSIAADVIRILQRFRAESISEAGDKARYLAERPKEVPAEVIWDDLSVSFDVVTFSNDVLVLEFRCESYRAQAVHPTTGRRQ